MAIYRYTAVDQEGRQIADRIEAASADEARRRLEERLLRVLAIEPESLADSGQPPRQALSSEEAGQLAAHVAQVSAAGLPLGAGLRAAGEESDNPRLIAALYWLADEIDHGRPLEEALISSADCLPRYVQGLIAASARTGQLGPALTELVERQRAADSLRREFWSVLAYPLLVACVAAVMFLFVILIVAGTWEKIFTDFGMQLPMLTQLFFWGRHVGIWILAGLVAVGALVVAGVRWRAGRTGWHRLLAGVPIFGPLRLWSGLAEWSGLLAVMIRHEVPLLEALRLSAEGVSDANVGQLSLSLAEGVARGRSLSEAMANRRQIPASLVPVVRWGEQAGELLESLGAGREMLEDRVRMRSFWLQMALPPALFIVIGCGALFVAGALLVPVVSLISALSG